MAMSEKETMKQITGFAVLFAKAKKNSVKGQAAMTTPLVLSPALVHLGGMPGASSKILSLGKRNGGGKGHDKLQNHKIGVARSMGDFLPDEMLVEFPYAEYLAINNAGVFGTTIRRQANALYDPDPAVGGSSFLSLATWASFYAYYRVVAYRYEIDLVNAETTSVHAIVLNTNTDPGTSAYTFPAYIVNDYCQSHMISPTGGLDRHTFRKHVNLSELVGTETFETDDNWRGLCGSSNPTDLIWLSISVSVAAGVMANGVKGEMKIWAKTRLFDRVRQTT
jgi:hypothetical protein